MVNQAPCFGVFEGSHEEGGKMFGYYLKNVCRYYGMIRQYEGTKCFNAFAQHEKFVHVHNNNNNLYV